MINVIEWKRKLLEDKDMLSRYGISFVCRKNEGEVTWYDPIPRSYEEYRRKYYVRNLP